MENERYEQLSKLVKTWHKEKTCDPFLTKYFYSICNLQESDKISILSRLLKNTKLEKVSNDDLYKMYSTNYFSKLNTSKLKNLFQETHNRYMNEQGYLPTRYVVVSNSNEDLNGFMSAYNDLLFMNKAEIDSARKRPSSEGYLNNDKNFGTFFLHTILHESRHVTQYEKIIDYALGKKQDKETEFLAGFVALCDINDSIPNVEKVVYDYDYQYIEHDANYNAWKNVQKVIPENEQKSIDFKKSEITSILVSVHSSEFLSGNSDEFVKNRVKKMEEAIKYEINFFNKNFKDCPMKNKILNTMGDFTHYGFDGESLLTEKLTKEITEMVEKAKIDSHQVKLEENDKVANLSII